jgi:hypothetical protein
VLHYRQGLLAEAKDIGQSSSTSKGKSLIKLLCSIVVQLFFLDAGSIFFYALYHTIGPFFSLSFLLFLVMWGLV